MDTARGLSRRERSFENATTSAPTVKNVDSVLDFNAIEHQPELRPPT